MLAKLRVVFTQLGIVALVAFALACESSNPTSPSAMNGAAGAGDDGRAQPLAQSAGGRLLHQGLPMLRPVAAVLLRKVRLSSPRWIDCAARAGINMSQILRIHDPL